MLVYAGMFINFGLYFSFISEGGIPVELGGVAIGMASTFGYLPEVLSYTIAGKIVRYLSGISGISPEFPVYDRDGRDWINRCDYLDKKVWKEKSRCYRSIIKKKEG